MRGEEIYLSKGLYVTKNLRTPQPMTGQSMHPKKSFQTIPIISNHPAVVQIPSFI